MTATDLVKFGTSNLLVSRICQGTAFRNMPREPENFAGQKVLEYCIEAGLNFFDSSNGYGDGGSEKLLGKAIAGKRDRAVVCTKITPSQGFTQEYMNSTLNGSLKRLNTDYVDLYLLHGPDGITSAENITNSMEKFVEEGKIRYWGVSNHSADQLIDFINISNSNSTHFAGVEDYYNIAGDSLTKDGRSRPRMMEEEMFPLLKKHSIGMLGFSPHDMGHLIPGKQAEPGTALESLLLVLDSVSDRLGVPRSQVCIAWVLAHPEVTSALGAAESPTHVDDNLAGAKLQLSQDVMDQLNAASIAYSNRQQVELQQSNK